MCTAGHVYGHFVFRNKCNFSYLPTRWFVKILSLDTREMREILLTWRVSGMWLQNVSPARCDNTECDNSGLRGHEHELII